MARLWVVRHGETEWNRERRIQGHLEVGLNANGRDQALDAGSRLALRFRGEESPAIYTSDLLRARQTALAIGRALERAPHVARKLRERSFGLLEGKTFAELAETHPEEVERYRRRGEKDAIPGAEPYAEFEQRSLRAIRAIARREERAIVVTHGGVIKVLLRAAEGEGKQFMVSNGAIYGFSVRGERLRRLVDEEEAVSSLILDALP